MAEVSMMAFAATAFAQQDAEFRPFTAELRVVHSPGPSQDKLYARRRDGSYVIHQQVTSPDGEQGTMVTIHDMGRNRSITLYPFLRASRTAYYSPDTMREWLWRGQDTCASFEISAALRDTAELVTAELNGREARRLASEDPRDGQRTEFWIAEELDCFPLRKTIAGGRGSSQQTTVTRLTEGEPDDSLFAVPQVYVEMSPGEIEAAHQSKYPGSSLFGELLQLMQRRYEGSLHRTP